MRRIRESLSLLEGDQREQLEMYRKERERKEGGSRGGMEGVREEGEGEPLLGGKDQQKKLGGGKRTTKSFRPRNSKLHR
jgi:hypothetical protein